MEIEIRSQAMSAESNKSRMCAPTEATSGGETTYWVEAPSGARDGEMRRALAFARSLANAGAIQLHYTLAQASMVEGDNEAGLALKELDSRNRCFNAARTIARILREDLGFGDGLQELGDIDFFIGVCRNKRFIPQKVSTEMSFYRSFGNPLRGCWLMKRRESCRHWHSATKALPSKQSHLNVERKAKLI